MNSNLTKLKMNQEVFLPNITGALKGIVDKQEERGHYNLYYIKFENRNHWLSADCVYNTAEEANNALLEDCQRNCEYCPHKGKCTL